MAATAPVKKSPKMIEWVARPAPLRDTRTVKKMNDQSLLLSLNKITHYYKKLTTGSELSELTLNV